MLGLDIGLTRPQVRPRDEPIVLVYQTLAPDDGPTIYFSSAVDCVVDWGDGNIESYSGVTSASHIYPEIGTYTVQISGYVDYFSCDGDYNLIKCLSFGEVGITSLQEAFRDCPNLTEVPTTLPKKSAVTNTRFMFYNAPSFNSDISGWDMSNVDTANGMFRDASSFNQDISSWDVSKIDRFNGMFANATSFDQNLGSWNISNATSMQVMFNNIALSTENYDALLIGWSQQTVNPNVVFTGGNSTYSAGAATTARGILTGAPNNWTIYDGGPA